MNLRGSLCRLLHQHLDSVIKEAIFQVAEHRLVLLLHHLLDDLSKFIAVENVLIGGLLASYYIPAVIEKRNNVRILDTAVLCLDMINSPFVLDIMIIAWKHGG